MISDSFCISLYPFTKQWISTYKKFWVVLPTWR
ncbi:hypothetical protein BRARA_D00574 [Brassica rapa]|uniref:Uncharacterized protein n=1 Tax=Brassica campestris TaxID=3711 RepID=A0A397ZJ06_BRACM|nr:hypothetical protein BRARA_D00574 [Brassica rapa]